MAHLIQPGTVVAAPVAPVHGPQFTLQELQGFVGGYIEVLRVGDRWVVINEDGKRLGLAYNDVATELLRGTIGDDDCIVGPALVCTDVEIGVGDV